MRPGQAAPDELDSTAGTLTISGEASMRPGQAAPDEERMGGVEAALQSGLQLIRGKQPRMSWNWS